MRVGLLQLNTVAGDLSGNAARIARAARAAAREGAALCVTPELALTGYPPRDLLLAPAFVRKAMHQLELLAAELADGPALLVGTAVPTGASEGRPLRNCAALLVNGGVGPMLPKTLLPTYDVFDEDRYFEPGGCPGLVEIQGVRLGVSICEDIWNDKDFWHSRRYHTDPLETLAAEGLDAILNLSASPFTLGKQAMRQRMIASTARKYGLPVLYCNQVGGNDDLVFDGRSMAFSASGELLARGKSFAEDVLVVDMADLAEGSTAAPRLAPDDPAEEAEAWNALVLGVRDYAAKCGFSGALLGLSGGIDSALTAAVAAEALGPDKVLGVLMPSPYSSQGSVDDSLELARRLGIATQTLPIAPIMDAFGAALAQSFAGLPPDTTEENIQSRIRGNLLMALSNKYGKVLLTTGNKSELAVGYCTIYGDMSGGLAVIADAPKTLVYRIAQHLNDTREQPPIPQAILDKAPSAELRPDQTDQDSLPPYEVLDAILRLRVELHWSVEEIAGAGFERKVVEKVCKLVKIAEFKRRQAAPGIKITDRAFGTGWRMPVACKVPY